MKFYTSIPSRLKPFYQSELNAYALEMKRENLQAAWNHLERAHIIGQRYPYAHSYVHWKMLLFGFKIKSIKEISGQIPRLFVGGVKSFVGKVPVGNPGGSNVPPLKPFPIEKELLEIFEQAGVQVA
ncbi:DUF3703 domain-containing protein [Cytophaga hutchinsonii]|uniref:DUF3703 domain-containing protein n=1 Tax=Cytophaga hutchinsonii (strain ATCC 33406 / DSM 1761 / CIP 103989 / NBRC 15051 / NCIMB 9469 / D465) TaxID=269798 RepID=A0A6N4SNY7_CYTH3|nr:DUF3703 domain-containing protein [Cytophaga hutchinsonii]ABG58013.1 conserved hypothetical protein [Cytophaga hutchinsonii ATCC 33406]SFX11426.1 Protein of unknown function [Cytophaga hutchinsonii ATCC 33406]